LSDYAETIEAMITKTMPYRRAEIHKIKEEFPNIKLSKIRHDLKIDEADIKTIEDVIDSYERYVENLGTFCIRLGYSQIDEATRGIALGEIIGFVARTAVGKTLFALNVIRNVIRIHKIPIMFFSLEQETPQCFERLAALTFNQKPVVIEQSFANHTYHDLAKKIIASYNKLLIVDKNSLGFNQLSELVARAEEEILEEKIPFVVIDYLGYMRSSGKDSYERTSKLAKEVKAFAKECKVAVLVLHQLSREALSGGEPVSLRMCRDSGVFEESCDYLLGAWRPELAEKASEEERVLTHGLIKVSILKNRCGGNKLVELWLNSSSLRIEER